jgi:hypothetical protein
MAAWKWGARMVAIGTLIGGAAALPAHGDAPYPAPESLGPTQTYGRHLQRAMTLLATSTPQHRNTVRVLFYGQSITEQKWSKAVADDLRRRFPNADLQIENRAIGGFASQLLVKTAETDLYPFYPDLVIFHVYGSHIEYENIIRRIRERTTAEILMQTDHVTKDEALTEETDPAKLTPKSWDAWMNSAFLPSTARKYGAELADQRNLWKQYLRQTQLPAAKLLVDGVHLNDHGNYLMAEIVKAYLRYDPSVPDTEWRDRVRTYAVGRDVKRRSGTLRLAFDGNRIDAICKAGMAAPAEVRIDGKRPSEFPELYTLTRTTSYPGSGWPCLLRVTSQNPLQLEEWTLTLSDVSPDLKQFRFHLSGSKTGPDGGGTSTERFVSPSGRVVIDPADWNLEHAVQIFGKRVGDGFQVKWTVVPQFTDTFVSPGIQDPAMETRVTLAQGLPNGHHVMEIRAGRDLPIQALRVYEPPLRQ